MSYIFDALQQSAAEQANVDVPSPMLATELLEVTECKTAAARALPTTPEQPPLPIQMPGIISELRARLEPAESTRTADLPEVAELSATRGAVDQFRQFPSLRVLVPPQSRLVCITEKESLAAEKFRFLGVRLRQLQQNRPLKKILITSTIPQEGKSMVAANLACVLAQKTQQKTLLIDGDLRRPTVARLFGIGKVSGLTDWLQGECGPVSSIHHLEDAGLWVLPAGNVVSRNPLELMQPGRLSALIDQLTSWFDWIVIDSPPVLPLADTSVWMRVSDGVLLVARQGTSEREQLKRGIEAIEPSKLLLAVLNCSQTSTDNDYYNQYSEATSVS